MMVGGRAGRLVWTILAIVGVIGAWPSHDQKRRDDPLTTPPVQDQPTPACYTKTDRSQLRTSSFRQKKNNDSPQSCAEACAKIHDDQDEVRTCRAFDHNVRTGACRFYERNLQDDNVRTGENSKTNLYELDESCWTRRNSRPTVAPHVSACANGSRPLMERVSGYFLKSSGLIFKQVPEKECVTECLKDQTPGRKENYKCQSASYNDNTQTCVYLSEIARPLQKDGPALTSDGRYRYYSKLCLSVDAVSKCPGYVTRFVGKQLVAMSDAKTTATNYSECVRACLTAETKLGFVCRSGMFYNKLQTDNCILNYSDHYDEHTLFVDGDAPEIDYFSLRSCQW